MSIVLNILLTLILTGILFIPVVSNHFIISQNGYYGKVAGSNVISGEDVNIIPNLQDFNGFVSFNPSKIQEGKYTDFVSLRSFQRQKASYKGLYQVYNQTLDTALEVEVVTTDLPTLDAKTEFEKILITLSKVGDVPKLTKDTTKGATIVELSTTENIKEGDKLIIGDELAEVVAISGESIVVTPLSVDHQASELVYPEAIYIRSQKIVNPRTYKVILQPGEKALVNAVVEGTANLLVPDGTVSIPLEFRVNPVSN